MKLSLSSKTIGLGFLATVLAAGLFTVKAVKAQTKLHSVPEIGWNTRLSNFDTKPMDWGQVFTFRCSAVPSTPINVSVWGTDIYTVHSGLCQAAVHAGMITKDGGLINVELNTEESDYQGSNRFGVQSRSYQGKIDSIRFLGNPIAQDLREDERPKPRRRPSAIERAVGNGVRIGIERTISDSIRDIFR